MWNGLDPALPLNKLPERIDEAEAALVISARELFHTAGDSAEEGESLDDAMCILHALLAIVAIIANALNNLD